MPFVEGCSRVMSPYRPLTAYAARAPIAPPAPAGFEFADLLRLIDARRALIARIAIATVLVAVAAALVMPTVWSSSAVVILDPRKNSVTDLSAVLTQMPTDPASVQNQIQIITSREVASAVVDRLKLYEDPEFNTELAPTGTRAVLGEMLRLVNPRNWFAQPQTALAGSREHVVNALMGHVSADAQGLSTTIAITARSSDGAKSAQIANAVAEAYVRSQVTTKVNATAETADWLNHRMQELAAQLEDQQAAAQRYRADNNISDIGPGSSLVDQQLAAINAQIVQARSTLAEKQAVLDRINTSNPADVGQIVASQTIIQLRAQQAQLLSEEASLNAKYGALHPKMQAIQQQKRDLEFKITQEVNRAAASANSDVLVARAHLNSLMGSLASTQRQATTQNMARVQLQALESNANSTRLQYEDFVKRLRQTQNMDEVQTPESRIISRAPVPTGPSGPRRGLIVGASIPVGLLLGLLAALAAEKLGPMMPVRVQGRVNGAPRGAIRTPPRRKTPSRPAPVAVWSGPPILADIQDSAALRAADFVLDYPGSTYARAMAGLVRQLESRPGAGAAIVAITSADNGENRSTIAVSLARAAAKMGKKAIVVDCAPARTASRTMKAPVKNGIYEVLTGAVPLNKALAKDSRGDVYVLGAPRRPAKSVTMFASRPMARLVSILRGGADFVVLDCGAAGAGPDAAVIARLADATVLVSRRQMLHSPLVANAAKILESAKAAPIGIVITK